MTGVPGGDVTLHAAITETLARHRHDSFDGFNVCRCGRAGMGSREHERHLADRLLAVLADRLPHTPAGQLATLIGGNTVRCWNNDETDVGVRVVGPWVPDSPPTAPETRQDT